MQIPRCSSRRATALHAVVVLACTVFGCGGEPAEPRDCACADETPRVIVVETVGTGARFAARVTDERDGLTGVSYADGDREWISADRIGSWPEMVGRRVQVFIRHAVTDVTVIERRGSLFHVRFEDRSDTWVSADMLYALDPAAEVAPDPPSRDPSNAPRRRPADRSLLRAGAFVLVEWVSAGTVLHGQSYLAQIQSIEGETVMVHFLSDGSVASVRPQDVFRVFDPREATVAVGERVFVAEAVPVATVLEVRADLVKVAFASEERWIERGHVLASAAPIPHERLAHGTQVTALWVGTHLYHGTVQGTVDDQVTLIWHEGSAPSAVNANDVVETWSAVDPAPSDRAPLPAPPENPPPE